MIEQQQKHNWDMSNYVHLRLGRFWAYIEEVYDGPRSRSREVLCWGDRKDASAFLPEYAQKIIEKNHLGEAAWTQPYSPVDDDDNT